MKLYKKINELLKDELYKLVDEFFGNSDKLEDPMILYRFSNAFSRTIMDFERAVVEDNFDHVAHFAGEDLMDLEEYE